MEPFIGRRRTAIIADDHKEVHPLLCRILEPEFEVLENVFDGQSLVNATVRLQPELIVVDIVMPVMDGIEAVRRIRQRFPAVAVVFISTDATEDNMQRAFKTGARAFVRKASAAEHLLPAARAALLGQSFAVAVKIHK